MSDMRSRMGALGARSVGAAVLGCFPGAWSAIREAGELQQEEMRLQCVVPADDLPAVLAEVDRRAEVVVAVRDGDLEALHGLLMGERPRYLGERLGRLRALQQVREDYCAGRWP